MKRYTIVPGNTYADTITANGREVTPGTELRITGESGRFSFVTHVTTPAGAEWIDVFGGAAGHETLRAFKPDRVRTVHRTTKTRANATTN